MTENEISYKIRGCIFNVYNKLGPGLLESAYEAALKIELEKAGCKVQTQVYPPMTYDGIKIEKIWYTEDKMHRTSFKWLNAIIINNE